MPGLAPAPARGWTPDASGRAGPPAPPVARSRPAARLPAAGVADPGAGQRPGWRRRVPGPARCQRLGAGRRRRQLASVAANQVSVTAQAWRLPARRPRPGGWPAHRHTLRALWTAGHRGDGVRQLAVCVLVDLAVAVVGLFVVAMIVSPVLGI